MRPSALFFGCRTHEKLAKKAGLKVCVRSLHPVFNWKRNTPSRQSLPLCDCNIGFVYCLYTGCFQALSKSFAHVGTERQKYIHTYVRAYTYMHACMYIHTYIHTVFTRIVPHCSTIQRVYPFFLEIMIIALRPRIVLHHIFCKHLLIVLPYLKYSYPSQCK